MLQITRHTSGTVIKVVDNYMQAALPGKHALQYTAVCVSRTLEVIGEYVCSERGMLANAAGSLSRHPQ
jgi:hypothetical protein